MLVIKHLALFQGMDHGLDFITSTPPLEYEAASPSPSLYLRVGEGGGGEGGLLMATARLGGADCQASGLPAPKCRELAMGETYADLGESHFTLIKKMSPRTIENTQEILKDRYLDHFYWFYLVLTCTADEQMVKQVRNAKETHGTMK